MRDGTPTGKAQTPRDKDKQCDTCGVEKIAYLGRDAWSGMLVYVGEKCRWRVKRDPDVKVLP